MFPFPFFDSFVEAITTTFCYVGIFTMSVIVITFFVIGEFNLIEKCKWHAWDTKRIKERFFDKHMR